MSIRTQDLRKQYGPVKALDGLTLRVEPGTVFGFLGPNGAGKSTTIRLLTGLAHPTSGKAWVAGEEIAHPERVASRIGYLPEEPAFYPWMTPPEFLDHVGRVFGLPASLRSARVKELLETVGLGPVAKRRTGGFSRGMRQRLGLAQALMNQPEVLLLDEPVSALDPAGRKEMLELIRSLRGRCTVFMSTHILADVERVCDSVGIIDHGKLLVEAPQQELTDRYTQPAFELEVDSTVNENGAGEPLQSFAQTLRGLPWVSAVALDGRTARVTVNDLKAAQQSLLGEVVRCGLPLRRYEMVTASLEDVFLKIIGQEG